MCIRDSPHECCGLLLGTTELIEKIVAASNIRPEPNRYQISPRDHFSAIHRARSEGLEVVGVYHSHPNAAPIPSTIDTDEATYPDYLYVIISVQEKTSSLPIKAYRLNNQAFEDVGFEVR